MKFIRRIFLALVGTSQLWSQAPTTKTPVEIVSTSNDLVGQRLVYKVKENIRASNAMSLTFDTNIPRFQICIVTIDNNPNVQGGETAYSAVFLWNGPTLAFPFYLNSDVGFSGSARIDEAAQSIVADANEEIDKVLRLLASLNKGSNASGTNSSK